MTKVLILQMDNWEALYLDGKSVQQYHSVEEGEDRGIWFLNFAEEHGLTSDDFTIELADDEDQEEANLTGEFPSNINELKGNYFDGECS